MRPNGRSSMVARTTVDLSDVYRTTTRPWRDNLDRCKHVSPFLLERAKDWLGDL